MIRLAVSCLDIYTNTDVGGKCYPCNPNLLFPDARFRQKDEMAQPELYVNVGKAYMGRA